MSRSALQLNFTNCGTPVMLSPPSLCAMMVFGGLFLDLLLREFYSRYAFSRLFVFVSCGE